MASTSNDGGATGIERDPLPYLLPPRETPQRDVFHTLRTNIQRSWLQSHICEYLRVGPDEEQVPTERWLPVLRQGERKLIQLGS